MSPVSIANMAMEQSSRNGFLWRQTPSALWPSPAISQSPVQPRAGMCSSEGQGRLGGWCGEPRGCLFSEEVSVVPWCSSDPSLEGREEVWPEAGRWQILGEAGAPLPLAPWHSLSRALEFRSNSGEMGLGERALTCVQLPNEGLKCKFDD